MKNFIKLFGIMALVVVIGFSMIACDDDDNDSIVGTWTGKMEATEGPDVATITIVVNSNGTGKFTAVGVGGSESYQFTWTQVGSTVSFTVEGQSDTFEFNGGNSFTFGGVTYKRK